MKYSEAILNEGDELVPPEGKCLRIIDWGISVRGVLIKYEIVEPGTYGGYNTIGIFRY